MVHRCVLAAFIGCDDRQVNHKNGIKSDNRLENLEYVTSSENVKHAYRTGLNDAVSVGSSKAMRRKHESGEINYAKGVRHGNAKLTERDVISIRKSNDSSSVIAARYGMNRRSISDIINRINWKHIP